MGWRGDARGLGPQLSSGKRWKVGVAAAGASFRPVPPLTAQTRRTASPTATLCRNGALLERVVWAHSGCSGPQLTPPRSCRCTVGPLALAALLSLFDQTHCTRSPPPPQRVCPLAGGPSGKEYEPLPAQQGGPSLSTCCSPVASQSLCVSWLLSSPRRFPISWAGLGSRMARDDSLSDPTGLTPLQGDKCSGDGMPRTFAGRERPVRSL